MHPFVFPPNMSTGLPGGRTDLNIFVRVCTLECLRVDARTPIALALLQMFEPVVLAYVCVYACTDVWVLCSGVGVRLHS